MSRLPNAFKPCYDCGSTVPEHHTASCALAPATHCKDLPALPGKQYWDVREETQQPTRTAGHAARVKRMDMGRNTVGNAARRASA